MVSRRRQGLSLTVLLLAGVAVVATSPRRWGLAGPPMNGLFELNTAHPTATQRFHLALPAAPNVAGHQVTFSLR